MRRPRVLQRLPHVVVHLLILKAKRLRVRGIPPVCTRRGLGPQPYLGLLLLHQTLRGGVPAALGAALRHAVLVVLQRSRASFGSTITAAEGPGGDADLRSVSHLRGDEGRPRGVVEAAQLPLWVEAHGCRWLGFDNGSEAV